jgi:hypothetical protein
MNHWTLDNCKVDAAKYGKRGEWSKNSSSAYAAAARNGWLDECCSHMRKPRTRVKRKPLKWHKEACTKDAQRFKYRSDWQRGSNSAYNSAKNNNWLDECCVHMNLKKGGNTERKPISRYWDLESCRKEAERFTSISHWNDNSGSSYQAALRNNWVEQCAKHMSKTRTRIEQVCDVCREELANYTDYNELRSNNPTLGRIVDILGLNN